MKANKSVFVQILELVLKPIHQAYQWLRRVIEPARQPYKLLLFHKKEMLANLLLGLLFAKMDKVHQFFTSFATAIKQETSDIGHFLFIFILNGFAVLWISYAFWLKPKNFKGKVATLLFGNRRDASYTKYYNEPDALWWLGVTSAAPVLLTSLTLGIALLGDNPLFGVAVEKENPAAGVISEYRGMTYILAAILYLVIAFAIRNKAARFVEMSLNNNGLTKLKRYICKGKLVLIVLGVQLAVFGALFYYYKKLNIEEHWLLECLLLLAFTYIPAFLMTLFWFITSKLFHFVTTKNGERYTDHPKYQRVDRLNETLRRVSYILIYGIFVSSYFVYLTTQRWYSTFFFPIASLMLIFIFYYTTWDLFVHNVTKTRRRILIVGALLLFIIAPRTEHYKMKFNEGGTVKAAERVSLERYFHTWAKERLATNDTVFYLVAAEGGGSRSGAWSASVLMELDSVTGGEFSQNCFAISSVSGGTVGSAATLALWDNAHRKGEPNLAIYRERGEDGLPKKQIYINEVFGRNYITSALWGILVHDFFQGIPLVNLLYPKGFSRTDRQQAEENDAISQGLANTFGQDVVFNDYYIKTNFLDLYYEKDGNGKIRLKTHLPLLFPNTARVQDGRRGVLSPVSDTFPKGIFVSAIDVLKLTEEQAEHRGKSIRLASAVGLSQLFPYVNSNVIIDTTTGTYMDGGAYENMGLTTFLEVCKEVKTYIGSPNAAILRELYQGDSAQIESIKNLLSKVKFQYVIIMNSPKTVSDELTENKFQLQLLDPLSTIAKAPFTGHTHHTYWQAIKAYENCAERECKLYEFSLLDDSMENIVMSRWLSKPELNYIFERADSLVRVKF